VKSPLRNEKASATDNQSYVNALIGSAAFAVLHTVVCTQRRLNADGQPAIARWRTLVETTVNPAAGCFFERVWVPDFAGVEEPQVLCVARNGHPRVALGLVKSRVCA
jgi:hypothetical protein